MLLPFPMANPAIFRVNTQLQTINQSCPNQCSRIFPLQNVVQVKDNSKGHSGAGNHTFQNRYFV